MIEYNDVMYRNLEEQVQKNKEDIAYHMEITSVLANFGITVLGRVNTYEDIADLDEGENWGYGYLVGEEKPYTVYVWTRPNLNIGKPEPYWLDIGAISVVGPTGPAGRSITNASLNSQLQLTFNFSDGSTLTLADSLRGPKGDKGKDGSSSRTVATRETNGVRITTYDQNNAQLSTAFLNDGQRGMTGATGPRGEAATLNIIGTFSSVGQAPNPQTRELGDAFILSDGGITTLYILTGEPDIISTYAWQETSFGGGTRITYNGQNLSTWRADSVVQKMVPSGITPAAYVSIDPFDDGLIGISQQLDADTIARRDSGGRLSTATPTGASHAANKQYVDDTKDGINMSMSSLEDRVRLLEEGGNGGGGSTGGGGWNTATAAEGTPLWLTLDSSKNYQVCLMSEHGVGDNLMCSGTFLLPRPSLMSGYAYGGGMKIPTTNAFYGTADQTTYWNIIFDPPSEQYSITFTYGGSENSNIHNITAFYKEM